MGYEKNNLFNQLVLDPRVRKDDIAYQGNPMKKLPIGIASFETLIKENYVYVDKTAVLHKLITSGAYYFFCRPRRFGKSLTISTLQAIFEGRKELFEGLAISKIDYAWPVHPVVRLDFAVVAAKTPEQLEEILYEIVHNVARKYEITLRSAATPGLLLEQCVAELAKKNKVVLLIDEYDKTVTDHITEPDLANAMLDVMANFYGVIKALDAHLKFVFITGVSKFVKMSVFSKLNNLKDISINKYFTHLVGYTEHELATVLHDWIIAFATEKNMSEQALIEKLRFWYDGYCFHPDVPEHLYSPQTVMNALADQEFKNYWFETGSATFLVNLMRQHNFPLLELEGAEITELDMSPGDIHAVTPIALLFQTGYLTIKSFTESGRGYVLNYPNFDVKEAFTMHMAAALSHRSTAFFDNALLHIKRALLARNVDACCKQIYQFFTGIPYPLEVEKHYHLVLYSLLSLVGERITAEDSTNIGRLDIMLEMKETIFIFELKKNATAQEALQQIIDRKYYEKFMNKGKNIILVGLDFNTKERNLREWVVKEL